MNEIERRNKVATLQMYRSEEECRGFWRMAPALGCKGSCVYCYLRGTLWRQKGPVLFMDKEATERRIDKWLKNDSSYVLNTGELCDSLCWDEETGFVEMAVPMFERQDRHTLLLLSKFGYVDSLVRVAKTLRKPITQTIASWSLAPPGICQRFESGTSSVLRRLDAAEAAQRAGYRIRLRIDPMIPIDGWEEEFCKLAEMILIVGLRPERVTLGSLRFKPRTARLVEASGSLGEELISFLTEDVEFGRYRVAESIRARMYTLMADSLRQRLPDTEIALCKESEAFRNWLGMTGACHCEV